MHAQNPTRIVAVDKYDTVCYYSYVTYIRVIATT